MKNFAILGGGISGITVGNILLDMFPDSKVTIYAQETRDIVSYVASAQFYPIWLGDNLPENYELTLKRWFLKSKEEFIKRRDDVNYGIATYRNHELFKEAEEPPAYFRDVLSNFEALEDHNLPAGYKYRFSFDTMIIDTWVYIPQLTKDFLNRGGQIVQREFKSIAEVIDLDEPVIFNCLGMGAKPIFGDEYLKPVKGVVLRLKPVNIGDVVVSTGDFIVAQRSQDLYLGASYDENWETADPTQQEEEYLFDNVKEIMETPGSIFSIPQGTLRKENIIERMVGFRPVRSIGPRVEKETLGDKTIIHNYGHGGNGIILSWGTAHEALSLL
ncbi:FAD-binding oxidoreductase [Candidatus Saccharibacteria bacterium]|nr:FAD-binding oxidoreductase [Candidatus Saccharibacteria bacterium]MBI3338107.1 FAD-binding oxidoreductase [Candidatus Saccharibacteria bacterium]